MRSKGEKHGNKASAGLQQAVDAVAATQPFEDVRNTLLRAAADLQSNAVTERILNDFLSTAATLIAAKQSGHKALEALIPALLSVACVLNAPVGFLDCILSTPWARSELQRDCFQDGLELDEMHRRHFINLPLERYLMDAVITFIYQQEVASELPPMFRHSEQLAESSFQHSTSDTRSFVAAALDGGTALHFAAASGRNKHVTWLLANGADLRKCTNAGDLPIQLVPKCDDPHAFSSRSRECNCSTAGTGDPAACHSQRTRERMAWLTLSCDLKAGVWAWFVLLLTSIACVLGLGGCHKSFFRREIGEHAWVLRFANEREARCTTRRQLEAMRKMALESRRLVDLGIQLHGPLSTRFDIGEPGGDTALTCSWQAPRPSNGDEEDQIELGNGRFCGQEMTQNGWHTPADSGPVDFDCLLKTSLSTVNFLQDFGLKSVQVKSTGKWMELPRSLERQWGLQSPEASVAEDLVSCQVTLTEQAEIFLCMAQAIYLSHRAQGFPEEGAKLANMRTSIACDNGKVLLGKVERHADRFPGEIRAVPLAYVRVLHAHICLLLAISARRSASPAAVGNAKQLIARWADMDGRGYVEEAGLADDVSVACLKAWRRAAAADLEIAETLRGQELGPEDRLSDVLTATVTEASGEWTLNRASTRESLARLQVVVREQEAAASAFLLKIAASAAAKAAAEVSAADALRVLSGAKVHAGTGSLIQQLEAAIADASAYPRMKAEVASARQLLRRWEAKQQASALLEAEVASARRPLEPFCSSSAEDRDKFCSCFQERLGSLSRAIAEAQVVEISVSGAKKVQHELQAQLTAVDAAAKLEALLASKPCGSAALKASVQKADAAASAAASSPASGHCEGLHLLQPVLQLAKRQLEIERSTELLQRAVSSCRTLADLPKLEAAILAARKTGDVDQDILRSASELRVSLDGAARTKLALESAVRILQRSNRVEDADALESAIATASSESILIAEEVKAAEEAGSAWRARMTAEAKLTRALNDGSSSGILARAVQEAVAAGSKDVAEAQRVLKAMQSLEAAMQRVQDSQASVNLLGDRISAAEAAGVKQPLISTAKSLETRCLLSEAICQLELALKPRADRSTARRAGALNAALETAEVLLGGKFDSQQGDAQSGAPAEQTEVASMHKALLTACAEARARLEEEAQEQERIEQQKAEQHRMRQEKLKAERVEREKGRQAKAEQQRLEKERMEKERAEKREAEKTERAKAAALEQLRPQVEEASSEYRMLERPRPAGQAPRQIVKPALVEGGQKYPVGLDNLTRLSCASNGLGSSECSTLPTAEDERSIDSVRLSSEMGSLRQPSPSESCGVSAASSRSNTPRPRGQAVGSAWQSNVGPNSQQLPVNLPEPERLQNPVPTSTRPQPEHPPAGLQSAWLNPPAGLFKATQQAAVVETQRPCSYFVSGDCRNGDACKFAHVQPALPQPQSSSPALKVPLSTVSVGAGALAFGAPGLNAFSSGMLRPSSSKPGARPTEPRGTDIGLASSDAAGPQVMAVPERLQPAARPYPALGRELNSLDLASGTFDRAVSPALPGIIRSTSANKAEAVEMAAQGSRVRSPFPGAHQWVAASELRQPTAAVPGNPDSQLTSWSQLEQAHPDFDHILQNLGQFGDFMHHGYYNAPPPDT